ncbi:Nuclease-related domain-containing protein [Butyrivibrio proteoclasticus]|uniref:Nuclease-related domain-containing protein n=1 Tax=Butyrivibrio proteoclasticus TaxID=43305 RepID=A0A1I5TNK9_9FIRM|nr:nuclease-related domain-containing protein [Butyrivibrio proteoclasticus]SFP84684.1 Nuclease-related domain-containing protein [Butyrivibrio proteoclasticus]
MTHNKIIIDYLNEKLEIQNFYELTREYYRNLRLDFSEIISVKQAVVNVYKYGEVHFVCFEYYTYWKSWSGMFDKSYRNKHIICQDNLNEILSIICSYSSQYGNINSLITGTDEEKKLFEALLYKYDSKRAYRFCNGYNIRDYTLVSEQDFIKASKEIEDINGARLQAKKLSIYEKKYNNILSGGKWDLGSTDIPQETFDKWVKKQNDKISKASLLYMKIADTKLYSSEDLMTIKDKVETRKRQLNCCIIEFERRKLQDDYGDIAITKERLLSQINEMTFNDARELYKNFKRNSYELKGKTEEINSSVQPVLNEYISFYENAANFVSNYLNQINKKRNGLRPIPEKDLLSMFNYFYGTNDYLEVIQKRKELNYGFNREKGRKGERNVNYALQWLSRDYVVLNDGNSITLKNDEYGPYRQEYDNIVIGPQGIFLIETKYYSGEIRVNKNGDWYKVKDSKTCGISNPLQQIEQHEKLMGSIVGTDIPITNIICMAHPKVIIKGRKNCQVPIVRCDRIAYYIENNKTDKKTLTDLDIQHIKKKIMEHSVLNGSIIQSIS